MLVTENRPGVLSSSVERNSSSSWLAKITPYFDVDSPLSLFGENIGHLILYATSRVRFYDVGRMLQDHFPGSFILVKQELSKGRARVNTDGTDLLTDIEKGTHYHCFITYTPKELGKNPHLSFESKVREMLKGKVRPKPDDMKPIDYCRPWKYTGFRKISDRNRHNYGESHLEDWDVFFASIAERRLAESNREVGKRYLVHITPENSLRVLNWVAYTAKKKTSKGRKNCLIYDNRAD